eukprot:4246709-Pleurochrysis_carterae.AAC.1
MDSPRWAASEARVRNDVARIVAQKKCSTVWHGGAVNQLPTSVVSVIGYFSSFCSGPTCAVVAQCLFARFGIGLRCRCEEHAAGIAYGKERCGAPTAEWVRAEATLKVLSEFRLVGRARLSVVLSRGVVGREGILSAVVSGTVGCGVESVGVGARRRRRRLTQTGGRGMSSVESDATGNGFSDQDVQVRRVSCM